MFFGELRGILRRYSHTVFFQYVNVYIYVLGWCFGKDKDIGTICIDII